MTLPEPRTDLPFLILLAISILELAALIYFYKWGSKCERELDEYKRKYQSLLNKTHTVKSSPKTSKRITKSSKG
jgi:hypothetical protein